MAKVAIISPNVIGKAMAGPGIRSWEFAKALSAKHDVTLVAPSVSDLKGENFKLLARTDKAFPLSLDGTDVMLVQNLNLPLAVLAKRFKIKVIVDAYDPVPLELLELFKDRSLPSRTKSHYSSLASLQFNFKNAHGILCASEKQRDLWLGFLLSQGIISPQSYEDDTSLRRLIDVVPFGLSSTPPKKSGEGLREKFGFSSKDHLLIWGGGIWNWFDPLSLIRAVHRLSLERSDIKLVFMGIKNPDPNIAEMAMAHHAIQLAKELGIIDKSIFFNMGWVPYDERQNYLLDASIGASTHFDHLETRFSFRTRMLDYIWAKLPILATEGDSFAELIKQHQLGVVVPYNDEKAIAKAIVQLIDDQEGRKAIKENLAHFQDKYFWESLVVPIDRMICRLEKEPREGLKVKDIINFAVFAFTKARLYQGNLGGQT